MKNPYDVNHPGKFAIDYVGFADEFYCFRLNLEDHRGLGPCMFEMEVSQWLFDTTQGKWHMGNELPYADHPRVNLFNPRSNDSFVLLQSLADVAMFEHEFKVRGITPTMLV